MDRRKFLELAALTGFTTLLAQSVTLQAEESLNKQADAAQPVEDGHTRAMQHYDEMLNTPKAVIGMLVYPGMFLQDLVGPLTMFEALMNREIHLLWKDTHPAKTDATHRPLVSVIPTTAFKDCPKHLDVLFVPGGVPGTYAMMEDAEVLNFLAEKGKTARFVTSVCTGSLILGAAGLLKGYKATSYWSTRNALKELGAIPTQGRVVIDRNRITGGGVTAGLDFGLKLVALLTNETYAKAVQLYLEYDPQPPFNAGSPETAPPVAKQFLEEMFADSNATAIAEAKRAWNKLSLK